MTGRDFCGGSLGGGLALLPCTPKSVACRIPGGPFRPGERVWGLLRRDARGEGATTPRFNLIIECRPSPVYPQLALATIKIRGSSRYTSASSHAKRTRLTAPHREQCSEQILPPARRATRSSRAAGSLSTRHTRADRHPRALSRHAAHASRPVHMGSPRTKRRSTSTNKQPSAGDHTPRRIPPSSTSTRGTVRPSHSRA